MKHTFAALFLALTFFTSPVWAQDAPKKRLLLVTESRGFVHSVVNRGKNPLCTVEKTFLELADKNKFFGVDCTQDARAAIEGDNLKKYDAVFFYTTGELPLSAAQKSDLLGFVRNGKGFGGSHCATDTLYQWKEYGDMIGAYFDGHPWHQKIKVIVEDKKHAATKHLGDSFEITDEIYQFRTPYSREKLHVLMRMDPAFATASREKELKSIEDDRKSLPARLEKLEKDGKFAEAKKLKAQVEGRKPGIHRADDDHALAWTREYGKGRVFYTALGHREEVWADPRFQQHIIGGLRYMFGMEDK
jgi:type 1 glutamine amidotransferase